ncbi:MAG: class I SAM-dependent methyltransferase [Ferruginibacter sp.]
MSIENQLKWTGERLVTDETLGKGIIEHLHRYAVALSLIKGKDVIDIACGEGYGSNLMSENAKSVTGIDISAEAIAHAGNKYKRHNLRFLCGSAIAFPCEDKSIDVVVSFETLEHHDKHNEMMLEIVRVLKKDGLLIISTPEKLNYNKIDKDNPFHVKELDFREFEKLITYFFHFHSFLAQSYFHGSVILPVGEKGTHTKEYNGDFENIVENEFNENRIYNIAIASNVALPTDIAKESFFNGAANLNVFYSQVFESSIQQNTLRIQQTTSYKLGNMIVKPLKKIWTLIKR